MALETIIRLKTTVRRFIAAVSRLSFRLSVTLRYRDHIGWNTSKIIPRLVSLGCSLFADRDNMDLPHKKHHQILAGTGVGYGKSVSRHTEPVISLKRLKILRRLLLTAYIKSDASFVYVLIGYLNPI